jgi:hypothetical protein
MPRNNYNPDASLFLQNAAMFLREWVKLSRKLTTEHTKRNLWSKPMKKLEVETLAWLKVNKLQGNIK